MPWFSLGKQKEKDSHWSRSELDEDEEVTGTEATENTKKLAIANSKLKVSEDKNYGLVTPARAKLAIANSKVGVVHIICTLVALSYLNMHNSTMYFNNYSLCAYTLEIKILVSACACSHDTNAEEARTHTHTTNRGQLSTPMPGLKN